MGDGAAGVAGAEAERLVSIIRDDIAPKVKTGECILFLGAGVHAAPPAEGPYANSYSEADRPLSGESLSRRLAAQTEFEKRFENESAANLLRTSLDYEAQKRSRHRLVEEIQAAVLTDKKPSPILEALARLGFQVIATTNYDRLIDDALVAAKKQPDVAIYSKEPVATPSLDMPTSDRPMLLKLHGDIRKPESIVITDEDYIEFVLRMNDPDDINPLPIDFKYFFKRWPTLFVGYRLMDYNLRVLFHAMRRRLDKANIQPTYSVDLTPDPLILEVWEQQRRYVQFIVSDVWTFVPELYRQVTGEEMPV